MRGQHGQRIGLGVEGVDGAGGPRPVARHRHVVAHAGGDRALAGGRRVLVLRADLEQRRIGEAARLVARGRVDQVGQDRGPHRVELGGDRVQQPQVGAAAAEALGLLAAAGTTRSRPRSGRARRAPGAPAARGAAAASRTGREVADRRGSDVVGILSKPQTRVTSSTRSASPTMSGRHDGTRGRPRAAAVDGEAELAQDRRRLRRAARRCRSASSRDRRAA